MQEELMLALKFLDEHPESAVRTLEQHDAARVADFLQQVPASYSELVVQLSLPAFAGNLCLLLGVETATRLLLEQDLSRMVGVLRHLPIDQVEAILQESPKSRRKACQMLLRFPLDSVGAWMVPNTAVVSSDFSVQEVLNFLKDALEDTFSKYVFVVDRSGIPQGRISYLRLLKLAPDKLLADVMEPDVATIPGHMLLGEAVKLSSWNEGDVMPVTGMQRQLIGVLRHADLRRGLRYLQSSTVTLKSGNDPLSGIVDAYGKSLLALFDTVSVAAEHRR